MAGSARCAIPAENNFRFEIWNFKSGKQRTNNNVNRRFAGRELKFAVAAADDETKERQ